jgi:hypothetical protein
MRELTCRLVGSESIGQRSWCSASARVAPARSLRMSSSPSSSIPFRWRAAARQVMALQAVARQATARQAAAPRHPSRPRDAQPPRARAVSRATTKAIARCGACRHRPMLAPRASRGAAMTSRTARRSSVSRGAAPRPAAAMEWRTAANRTGIAVAVALRAVTLDRVVGARPTAGQGSGARRLARAARPRPATTACWMAPRSSSIVAAASARAVRMGPLAARAPIARAAAAPTRAAARLPRAATACAIKTSSGSTAEGSARCPVRRGAPARSPRSARAGCAVAAAARWRATRSAAGQRAATTAC